MPRLPASSDSKNPMTPYLGGLVALLAIVGALLVACGDGGADDLLAHTPGSSSPQSTNPDTDGGTLADGAPLTEAGIIESQAEQMFRAMQKQLIATCGGPGGGCHVTGAYQNGSTPVWLGQPDPYLSAKAYPGIITSDPYSSKLMIKGPHEGPDFSGPNAALGQEVLAWLTEEALAIKAVPLPSTAPATIVAGPNVIDISAAGKGIAGAKISFIAAPTGGVLTLKDLSIEAPTTTAIHVAHPVFSIVTGQTTVADPVDSLSDVDQQVPSGESVSLGGGTLILEGWATGAQIQIGFNTLEAIVLQTGAGDDGGTVVGGCKALAQFTQYAVPEIQNNGCLNCHGSTNGSGYNSLDLTQVGQNEAVACAQALTRVDLANKAQSDIILAPTGGVAAHPFQNADANYKTMMLNWINAE